MSVQVGEGGIDLESNGCFLILCQAAVASGRLVMTFGRSTGALFSCISEVNTINVLV